MSDRGDKRASSGSGSTTRKKISNGYFHPTKKGVLQSFSFELKSSEVDNHVICKTDDDGLNRDEIENTYKGYSVGEDDIVFDVKVTTTYDDISVELIRVSQKYNTVHLVHCQAIVQDLDHLEGYHNDRGPPMEPLNFKPTSFYSRDDEASAYACQSWPDHEAYGQSRWEAIWWDGELEQPPRISVSGCVMYEEQPSTMVQEVTSLFNNEENSDVKICVGEEKKVFVAHKCILSVRSSFFHAMLSSNMRESVENIVNLPDESPEIFQQLLHYIYTDICPEISQMPADLLILSDKYDVKGLRTLCEEEIEKTMNTENVCDYLIKCEMINAKEIYDKCYIFICENKQVVTKTSGWEKLKEMANSRKVLADMIKKIEK